jgi:hypothetical protein
MLTVVIVALVMITCPTPTRRRDVRDFRTAGIAGVKRFPRPVVAVSRASAVRRSSRRQGEQLGSPPCQQVEWFVPCNDGIALRGW